MSQNNFWTKHFLYMIWIIMMPIFPSVLLVDPQLKSNNACYSTGNCGFHFLSCDPGLTITIQDASYGYKNVADVNSNETCDSVLIDCSAYLSCCVYDATKDCLKAYTEENERDVRVKCDGHRECSFQATRFGVSGGCAGSLLLQHSTFSVVQYTCGQALNQSQCVECTTSKEEIPKSSQDDIMQLIIGVSIGLAFGIVALIIIGIICLRRMKRKVPATNLPISGRRNLAEFSSGRTSTTYTKASSRPSSFSTFFNSQRGSATIPSSYAESVYSVPADVVSSISSIDYSAFYNNFRIHDVDVSSPRPISYDNTAYFPPSHVVGAGALLSSSLKRNEQLDPRTDCLQVMSNSSDSFAGKQNFAPNES